MLCADWSKDPAKREVYAASVARRRVWRIKPPSGGWNVKTALDSASRLRVGRSPVLVGFDAPIGVPASFLKLTGAPTFKQWLWTAKVPSLFQPVSDPHDWSVRRPFFLVPEGKGSRSGFENHLRRLGVTPKRRIDEICKANPVFIAAGIAGAVGSAAIDLWRGLRGSDSPPPIWPFDGTLADLLNSRAPVVVAEIYPRLAYSLAGHPARHPERSLVFVSKTQPSARVRYMENLLSNASWLHHEGVTVNDHWMALASEDAFDALVTAAGLLRCLLERTPLNDQRFEDPIAEGGILGSGSVCLEMTERLPAAGAARSMNASGAAGSNKITRGSITRTANLSRLLNVGGGRTK